MVPASIRNKNPGAQYPGKTARRFGALRTNTIGGGHLIAEFPDHVSGGAALFALLAQGYAGLTLRAAITKWSGGNHVSAYLETIKRRTGLPPDHTLSHEFLRDPDQAIPLAQAMAAHEAGQDYPMTDAEWLRAHTLAFGATAETVPPWLAKLLEWEAAGVKEVPGAASNPIIDEMFLICGHPKGKFRDDTAWCAVAAYAALANAGYAIPGPAQNTMARSFLRFGVPVALKDVRPGDFRVMARGPAPFGHVDCVVSVDRDAGTVEVIGGNIGDKFTRRTLPLKGALGYRRPNEGKKPVIIAVKESPSLGLLLRGVVATVGGVLAAAWDFVADLAATAYSALPGVAGEVSSSVGASRQIAEHVGYSLPAKLLFALAAASALVAIWRLIEQRREAP